MLSSWTRQFHRTTITVGTIDVASRKWRANETSCGAHRPKNRTKYLRSFPLGLLLSHRQRPNNPKHDVSSRNEDLTSHFPRSVYLVIFFYLFRQP